MSNNMKSSNEYQLYEMAKGNNDPKWLKKGNIQKGKEIGNAREDKGEYIDHQQYQKHPNRKNHSSYSNKNQREEYDNMIPGQKGINNQSPNYKKNQKFKKENENEYSVNPQIDDQNDKDEFQTYKKSVALQNSNREGGGFNPKGNKGKYKQHQNGNYVQGQGQQSMTWDKSPMALTNSQQQGQFQMGGYYEKKNYTTGNSFPNQSNPNSNPNPNTYINQFNQQAQYIYRSNYQNEPKPNIINLQQTKRNNAMNSNGFNVTNNQQIPGEYMNKGQGLYQYCNTEGNTQNNMSLSINQEQEPSNDSEDSYLQQPGQFMYNRTNYAMNDQMDRSFMPEMNDSMMPGSRNLSNMSYLSSPPIQQQYPNIPSMPAMNQGYQQEMFMQQQQQPLMNQGNMYLNDPQTMKGLNRNMPMMNMPHQQMPLGMEQPNQMFQMQQGSYGMNQANGGMMTKAKKKSSKKIAQSPQEGMNNPKGGMKLHYNNNSGKYYKGSHSTQGVKNTMPNFNGTNLSLMNMNSNSNANSMQNVGGLSSNQILPLQMNNQSPQRSLYKQKRNMYSTSSNNSNSNNLYRNVASDNAIGSGIVSTSSKSKGNDYYTNNKFQQNQYYNSKNQQRNRKYQQKYEDCNTHGGAGGDCDQNMSNQDPNEFNPTNRLDATVSFFVKVRLEENKEAFIEVKQNEDPISVLTTLKQYKISENQLTLVYNKIVETLNIMNNVINVQLNFFDIKQMTSLKGIISPSINQIEHQRRKHHCLPLLQIEQPNETFSYEAVPYVNCLSDIKPDYSDIKYCELINTSQ